MGKKEIETRRNICRRWKNLMSMNSPVAAQQSRANVGKNSFLHVPWSRVSFIVYDAARRDAPTRAFGASVQRPWPLARGGANELRAHVLRKTRGILTMHRTRAHCFSPYRQFRNIRRISNEFPKKKLAEFCRRDDKRNEAPWNGVSFVNLVDFDFARETLTVVARIISISKTTIKRKQRWYYDGRNFTLIRIREWRN